MREKLLPADIACPMRDGRLAVGWLCALQGRHDEAAGWFGRARVELDALGARPLRALVDFDEALMYLRRDAPGDRQSMRALLEAAAEQFETLGMTGWLRRAAAVRAEAGF